MYDLVIKNGTVIDGTGASRFFGDVAIKDGLIERIDNRIPDSRARRVIDAEGKIVAPGVIDPHTHYDAQIFWDPYATNSGWHGVTTVATGNCGFGFAPCRRDKTSQDRIMLMMEHTEQIAPTAMRQGMSWDFESLPDYIGLLRNTNKAVNVSMFMPLNPLLAYVMGMDEAKGRRPSNTELQQMKDLLNEAMDAGALGFAFSWQGHETNHVDFDGSLMPSDIMDIDVAYSLGEVLRERGHGAIQVNCTHTGYQDNSFMIPDLARHSKARILFNSISASAEMGSECLEQLKWLDELQAEGLNVYAQSMIWRPWMEFTAMNTNHWDPVVWMREYCVAEPAEKLKMSADPEFRARLREDYDARDLVTAGGPFEKYVLLDGKSSDLEQYRLMSIGKIAEARKVPVQDAFLDVVLQSKGQAIFRVSPQKDDADVMSQLMKHPRVIAGTSDGGAHNKFHAGGHYPTDQIKWFTRETNTVDLEVVHQHQSYVPARALGLHKRGALLEGWAADLYIYDHARIDFPPAFVHTNDLPGGESRVVVPSIGVEWTIVNGEPTLKGMEPTGTYSGRVVGNSGAPADEMLREPLAMAAE